MISSPCIKICEIDRASRLCRGCGRSLNEIAQWGSLSEAQRLQIMATLPQRLRDAGLPFPAAPGSGT
ncbi:MAG TPA: DUF1289 domain-containing protein [Rhizomicrobium sp.]|jgi:hypothetical protein|nr:DUF1289 domain-containing protein [Rhizomicrobium sp.]